MQLGFSGGISRSAAIVNAAAAALVHRSVAQFAFFVYGHLSLELPLPAADAKVRPPPRLLSGWPGAAPQKKCPFSFVCWFVTGIFPAKGRQMRECDWEMRSFHLIPSPMRE